MQYTRLGNTGLIVSRLAFGVMTFGSSEGAMASIHKVDQQLAQDLVDRAMDAGVNFFDTADAYSGGQSETMLGQALGSRRGDVVIATKVGFRTSDALHHTGLSRRHLMASAQASLKRLGTDYIDVYLVHRVDPFTPMEETLETLNDLVRMGMVRYVGFSNWAAWQAAKAVGLQKEHGWARFCAAQMYYSLLGRDLEHEVSPFVQDAGIGTMIWSPLAGGFLTGKYTRQDPTGGGGRIAGFDFLPMDRERAYDLVERMQAIASSHQASVAQVALAWLLAQPCVSTILVGATKMTQLDDNLKAAELVLSAAELAELDCMTVPTPIYPNWFNQKTGDSATIQALGESFFKVLDPVKVPP